MRSQREKIVGLLEEVNAYFRKWASSDGVAVLDEREFAGRTEMMVGNFFVIGTPGGPYRYENRWSISLQEAIVGGSAMELIRLNPLLINPGDVKGDPKEEKPSPKSWAPSQTGNVLYLSLDPRAFRLVAFPG